MQNNLKIVYQSKKSLSKFLIFLFFILSYIILVFVVLLFCIVKFLQFTVIYIPIGILFIILTVTLYAEISDYTQKIIIYENKIEKYNFFGKLISEIKKEEIQKVAFSSIKISLIDKNNNNFNILYENDAAKLVSLIFETFNISIKETQNKFYLSLDNKIFTFIIFLLIILNIVCSIFIAANSVAPYYVANALKSYKNGDSNAAAKYFSRAINTNIKQEQQMYIYKIKKFIEKIKK